MAQDPRPADLQPVAAVAALPREDLAGAFGLFLGKEPPPAPVAGAETGLAGVLARIFASEEFRAEVLKPLVLREALPRERFADAPTFKLIDWAQRRLPVDRATAVACGAARSWASLLEVLLADEKLGQLSAEFAQSGVAAVLRERVARDPQYAAGRSVVGAIDAASSYEVRGWAADLCDKSRPVTLEFYADGSFIGVARCDEPRPDVADVVGGDGNVGFTFRIAAVHRAAFAQGCSLVAVDAVLRRPIGADMFVHGEPARHWDGIAETRREIAQIRRTLERIESQLPQLHRMASLPLEAYGDYWERFYRPAPDVLARQRDAAARFAFRPLVSVVVPAYQSAAALLDRAVRSVQAQSYERWELIVSDDASADASEFEIVRQRHAGDGRIRWLRADRRGGIAVNTNRALAAAQGEYVAFLDHDDELAPEALYAVAAALQERRHALLYSDEDRIEDDDYGRCVHHTPFFKTDYDPDLLLSMNYMCHLVVVERQALADAGGLRAGVEGAQDHDLLLRLAARLAPERICHIPRVLYHWRVTPGSVSRNADQQEALRRTIVAVVDAHLRDAGQDAVVEPHSDPVGRPRLFANRVRWRLPAAAPKVSIILPTRDRLELLEPCVDSVLRAAPAYAGETELIIVDNDSVEEATKAYFRRIGGTRGVRVLPHGGKFNWSAINNRAAQAATGEILVFLNNDTLVLAPDWCGEMVAVALRPEVGAVGARLLYQDGTLQHAGVVLGVDGVAGHEAVGEPTVTGGYFGRTHLLRSVTAVTGACLATRRQLFQQLGGFDELHLKVAFNDVDYCMRVREAGLRVVYTPYAVLYHLESKSRGRELTPAQQARHRSEAVAFRARWGDRVATDPYYNPHFERFARPFDRLQPPPE
jgi:GT2 family glycosyltransferase